MAAPTRFTSGFTQAASFQPLGAIGTPDPFFYVEYEDDFLHYNSGDYTNTDTGGSTAATASFGTGGRILQTTGATAGQFNEIQLSTASFQYVAGKKLVYLARIQLATATTNSFIAGLIETNVTPFSSVADGVYFFKAVGSTTIQLLVRSGSATIGSIANVGTITAATDIDLGFYIDRLGNIKVFTGSNLEGVKRQNTATLGPDYGLLASSLTAAMPTAQLNPTIAVTNGATAAATTMAVDFQYAAQER
jgi:hypothetical protein